MASDTELWRGTDYGWWLAADTSGAVGASLIAFAAPLIMLATTGSSAAATTTESICVVVQTVLGPAGGVIQDRYDRRTLMLIWGASGVVLSAVAAAAVMLFGNAPKTSGHGVNGGKRSGIRRTVCPRASDRAAVYRRAVFGARWAVGEYIECHVDLWIHPSSAGASHSSDKGHPIPGIRRFTAAAGRLGRRVRRPR